jgi:hypothetical protein
VSLRPDFDFPEISHDFLAFLDDEISMIVACQSVGVKGRLIADR